MSKNILFGFFLFFFTLSCGNSNQAPPNLIGAEKMAHVIKDLMLLEATYNTKLIRAENKDELMVKFSNEIFEKHQVTRENFDSSYEYYSQNSDKFEAVLELVFEELNKMETQSIGASAAKQKNDSTLVSE
jgi:hypothetical protein